MQEAGVENAAVMNVYQTYAVKHIQKSLTPLRDYNMLFVGNVKARRKA